jgi:hypothetical protein
LRIYYSIFLLLLIGQQPIAAQEFTRANPPRVAAPVSTPLNTSLLTSTSTDKNLVKVRVPATHWKRGALIGSIAGAGLWILVNLNQEDGGNLRWGVATAPLYSLAGAAVGALIGGLFKRQ